MLKNTFCSSPWFHFRIETDGRIQFCRWGKPLKTDLNVATTDLKDILNSRYMSDIRKSLLDGQAFAGCEACYFQDKPEIDKISGRAKQLLKSGILMEHFTKGFLTSPHYKYFQYSYENNGQANSFVADLQIDIGTFCNSECIMCSPRFSSRLETTFKKLNWYDPTHELYQGEWPNTRSWADDPATLDRVINGLVAAPELRNIHFIGGEPLVIPAFYKILNKLVETGISKKITMGFTTNGTVYNNELANILNEFDKVHIGLSIESPGPLNDYIRYPGKIEVILNNVAKFKKISDQNKDFMMMLRATPNAFSIWDYDKLIEYQIANNLYSETCNVLYRPEWLQIRVLPKTLREQINLKIEAALTKLPQTEIKKNVNMRAPGLTFSNTINDARAFQRVLVNDVDGGDELRFKLVKYIKQFESLRNNSIIEYLPDYEQFLRQYGY